MRRSIIGSMLTEGVVMLAVFGALRIASVAMSEESFAYFAVGKRAFGMINLPLMLGLGLSIPRMLPRALQSQSVGEDTASTIAGATVLFTATHILACCAIVAFTSAFARIFLGSEASGGMAAASTCAIAGMGAHALGIGILRGLMNFKFVNVLKVINMALIPIVVMLLCQGRASEIFVWTGLCQSAITVAVVVIATRSIGLHWPPWRLVRERAREQCGFGLPRVPGEWALMGLRSIPVVVAANRSGPYMAAQLSVGVTILGLVNSLCSAVDLVLLPSLSRMKALHDIGGIWRQWRIWFAIASVSGLTAWAVFYIAAPIAATFLMPHADAASVALFRKISIAMPGVAISVVLRGFNDALDFRPYNSIVAVVSLVAVLFCLLILKQGTEWVAIVVGALVNGALTALVSFRRIGALAVGA